MNIVSIISPLIDVSTGRRGEAEECGEGGISIGEEVNGKADRNVSRREGGLTLGCVLFPQAGRAARGSQPWYEANQGRRWPQTEYAGWRWVWGGDALSSSPPPPKPPCLHSDRSGSRQLQEVPISC